MNAPRSAERIVDVTVAIPTFGREGVLLDTIRHLLDQRCRAAELLIVDQTPKHENATRQTLDEWDQAGAIRWLQLARPSITAAMNTALREAKSPIVLFIDDDIVPNPDLVGLHAKCHQENDVWAVTGQVLQPGESACDAQPPDRGNGLVADLDFPFNSTRQCDVRSCMAGNLSVRRDRALGIGGFDENFRGVAYRFETEFARRIWHNGGRVLFEPAASIRHLRSNDGGTRIHGNHLASGSPTHGVGDYYFALLHGWNGETILYIARRIVREVSTRFHLKHPWWIPVKLVGEMRAILWACRLVRQGPRLITPQKPRAESQAG